MKAIAAVARTHHSLITLHQTRTLGSADAVVHRAERAGYLERVHAGVYRVTGAPITRDQLILAAVLACGPGAMASHRSSAHVWDVPRPKQDPIDVIVGRRCGPAPRGVRVHRPTDRDDLRIVTRRGIPTVMPLRMLLDLGAVDRWGVPAALDSVLTQRLMKLDAIDAGIARHSRQGRHGVVTLRRAVAERQVDGQPPDSELEVVMAKLCRRFRLPPMEFHATVAGFEVDFLVVGVPLVIECDGWSTHGLDREQFDFDRERDSLVLAAGYVTLRVTWRQLTGSPERTAQRIRAAIAAASRFSAD